MKRIYLDYAAATPVDAKVSAAMTPFSSIVYANPSAIHAEGVAAKKALESARTTIAELVHVHSDEIIFTASATESVNLAIIGAVQRWQKHHPALVAHVIVSSVEHDAVLESVRLLESGGVEVDRVPVLQSGVVDLELIQGKIQKNTVIISVMYANNEIGTIQPIKDIAKLIRKWKKDVRGVTRIGKPEGDQMYPLLHTDACQAVNYCDTDVASLGVDLMTFNAAKIYGPKGVGALIRLRGIPIESIVVGGGHEYGLRAGTENVSGIVGFAEALKITKERRAEESVRLTTIRDYAILELEKISGLIINGDKVERLPNNIHFSLPNIDHEFLALALDAKGFAVATKSACNEFDTDTSHVLAALRLADGSKHPQSGIRTTLGRSTQKHDIDIFVATLKDIMNTVMIVI